MEKREITSSNAPNFNGLAAINMPMMPLAQLLGWISQNFSSEVHLKQLSFINPLLRVIKTESLPLRSGSWSRNNVRETCWSIIKKPVPIRVLKRPWVDNSKFLNGCPSPARSRSPQHIETNKLLPAGANEIATVAGRSDQDWAEEISIRDQEMKEDIIPTQIKMDPSENGSVIINLWDTETSEQNDYAKAVFKVTKIDRKTNKEIDISKNRHMITHWNHVHAKYYAKGMWKKWYFSKGQRKKFAYEWIHSNRPLYATGMCKLWYLKEYHRTHERKRDRIKRL